MSKYIDAEKLKEKLVEESVWAALKVVEIVDKMIEEHKDESQTEEEREDE